MNLKNIILGNKTVVEYMQCFIYVKLKTWKTEQCIINNKTWWLYKEKAGNDKQERD